MNSSADFGIMGQLPCSGSNAGASYSSVAGLDGISRVARTDTVHNFTDKLPDGGRLVFVGIDAGYSAPFIFLSIHSGDL